MKSLLTACCIAALSLAANGAFAADSACEAQAAEKKLAGAAKGSFIKKCEADAKGGATEAKADDAAAKCEASAKEKKLAGAAKTNHLKKCVADAKAEAKK